RADPQRASRPLQRLSVVGPCNAGAYLPDHELDPFGAGHPGSVAVSATDPTRPRCDHPRRSDADRRRLRLAQATTLVAATRLDLTHLPRPVLPTFGQRIAHVGPRRGRCLDLRA